MSPDAAKAALSLARVIQDSIDSTWLPPPEIAASRTNAVVPFVLVKGTRRYIENVVHQINSTYENACYDACAVMLRRLIETLIIETFEAHKIADHIKGQGEDFLYLSGLIDKTLDETSWNLSRNAKRSLRKLKDVGDTSAHSRRYNAVRHYIDELIPDARTAIHELIALSGLK